MATPTIDRNYPQRLFQKATYYLVIYTTKYEKKTGTSLGVYLMKYSKEHGPFHKRKIAYKLSGAIAILKSSPTEVGLPLEGPLNTLAPSGGQRAK